jgi:hypothetical protein
MADNRIPQRSAAGTITNPEGVLLPVNVQIPAENVTEEARVDLL